MQENRVPTDNQILHAEMEAIVHNQKILNIAVINTILSIVIIILLLFLWPCNCNMATPPVNPVATNPTFNVEPDPNIEWGPRETRPQEEIEEELRQQVEEGMMNISMNTNPVFDNGSAAGNLLIVNEDFNRYAQVVEIYRDDTGELVYRSGAIPVGARIDNAKLTVPMSQGIYDCTAHFNQIDENGNFLGKACAKIKIYILH